MGGTFAQGKGGFAVGDDGGGICSQDDFHDVESDGYGISQQAEPVASATAQQSAFAAVDGACGGAVLRSDGALHLDEHKGIAIAADDIHLTGAAVAEVVPQYFQTVGAQPGGGYQLGVGSPITGRRRGIRIPRAAPSVQQVQTSGDDVP